MPGCVVGKSVVLLRSISRSVHEDDAVVTLVPEARPRPSLFIKDSLIGLPRHVSCAISNAPIAEYQAGTLVHLCQSRDVVLEVNLELDDVRLELNDVSRIVLAEIAQSASHTNDGGYLGHNQDFESAFGEMFFYGFEGCALTGTWSASEGDAVYGVFLVFFKLVADAVETQRGGRLDEELGDGWNLRVDGVGDHPQLLVLAAQVLQEGHPGDSQCHQGQLVLVLYYFSCDVSHKALCCKDQLQHILC